MPQSSGSSDPHFSHQRFWAQLAGIAKRAGREVVEKALILYYAAQRPETPLWAKTVIYSALAYLFLPTDAIPDITPIAGFTDDWATLLAALGTVAMAITPEVQEEAKAKTENWFGTSTDSPEDATEASGSGNSPVRVIPID